MKDFLSFAQRYDPGLPSRLRGASPEEIEQLELYAGRSLPEDYRLYLQLMGRWDDGLDVFTDATGFAPHLLEYYEEVRQEGGAAAPPGHIIVAVSGLAVNDLCIDDACTLYRCDGEILEGVFADSLEQRAHAVVFERYEPRRFAWSGVFDTPDARPIRDALCALAQQEGFVPQEFSDRWTCYATAPQGAILFYQGEKQRGLLRIAGTSQDAVTRVGTRFEEALGVRFREWQSGQTPIRRRLHAPPGV